MLVCSQIHVCPCCTNCAQYFIADGEVVWDAEYEDIILQDSKGVKICDHTKLNSFRTIH